MYKLDKIENMFDFYIETNICLWYYIYKEFRTCVFAVWRGTMEKNRINIEMTNEEYKIELSKIFQNVDNNRLLRYFYKLIPKLIEEWK